VIYLDANVLIRLLEGDLASRQPIEQRLAGETAFLTSQLTRLECRCKPLREGNAPLLALYDQAFASREMQVIEIDGRVIDEATALRAAHNLKTPDAIHVASAVVAGATVFLTGDAKIAAISRIKVEVI